MIVVLSLVLGGVVYGWSLALFGRAGALLSVGLYALSPTLLAHARLVTADLAAALFFLLATGAIWRLLERVTPMRLAAAALATAGLLLSKMSGLLILPTAAVLILVRLGSSRGLELAWGCWRRDIRKPGPPAADDRRGGDSDRLPGGRRALGSLWLPFLGSA